MTLKDRINRTTKGRLAWHQERSIFETTNLMCRIMGDAQITCAELAGRMGTTKGYVTQLLDGMANLTLRTFSDVFVALGREFHPGETPIDQGAPKGRRVREHK